MYRQIAAKTIPKTVAKYQDMSVEETAMWVQNLGGVLGWNKTDTHSIASKFRHYEIDGKWIVKLENSSQLKEIKIKKLGYRMAIVKAAKHICIASELVERLKRDKVDIMEKYFQKCRRDSDFSLSALEISNSEGNSCGGIKLLPDSSFSRRKKNSGSKSISGRLYSILKRRKKLKRRNRNEMIHRNTYL